MNETIKLELDKIEELSVELKALCDGLSVDLPSNLIDQTIGNIDSAYLNRPWLRVKESLYNSLNSTVLFFQKIVQENVEADNKLCYNLK